MLFGYDILYLTDELEVMEVLMKKSITLNSLRFNNLGEMYTVEVVYNNPFDSIIDCLDYYKWIATDAPIEELRAFADYEIYGKGYDKLLKREELYRFQLKNMSDFSDDEMDEIVKHTYNDPFYSEFYAHGPAPVNCIEFYVVAMAELRAFSELSDVDTQMLKWFWIGSEDFIVTYKTLGLDYIVAQAYKILGYRWFCEEAYKDTVRYQYGVEAIFCAKKYAKDEEELKSLKKDLFGIYENILFSVSLFDSVDKAMQCAESIKESIDKWDEKEIRSCLEKINELEKQNQTLEKEQNKILQENEQLKNSVITIQKSNNNTDDAIETILDRIFLITKPDDKEIQLLKDIWDYLSNETKKDINASWLMYSEHQMFDLAVLPLLRSLEREFKNHIIKPYYSSVEYKKVKSFNCNNQRNMQVHQCLQKSGHPTMGNIPYIGKAVKQGKTGSEVIDGFSRFLGNKRKEIIKVCDCIGNYKAGTEQLGLIQIRNAVAHGDDVITEKIDGKCFEDIQELLLDEPIRLLNDIVCNSFYIHSER